VIFQLDGERITSESHFHDAITAALALSQYYGRNLSALNDVLSIDVERPLQLVWNNADISRRAMGPDFDRIVSVLRRVESEDARIGYRNRFQLHVREATTVCTTLHSARGEPETNGGTAGGLCSALQYLPS
jgi:ribonuclease inhibitor